MPSGDHVLVLGRTGQLARSLLQQAQAQGIEATFAGRPETDFLNADDVREAVKRTAPGVIINTAAYTAVDQAEAEPEDARKVNALAPAVLASAAREAGARLIHVSTDYVFNGEKDGSFTEEDPTDPLGVYGATKLEGEIAVRTELPDAHVIIRTAWVYSPFGRNFVRTMLNLAATRDEIRVVDDQVGNPTSALDLADAVLAAVAAWRDRPELGLGETYHLAGTGSASWADLAREALGISAGLGGPSARVIPITSAEYPTPARRPANSRLDSSKFERTFGYRAPPWRTSLQHVVERLVRETH